MSDDLRTGLVEAIAQGIYEESVSKRGIGWRSWVDLPAVARIQWMLQAERGLDRGLGFLTDNADFQNLVWPRDKELPKNPEEWPLVPKLELLAAWGDGMDDRDGKYDESERTVQIDVRRAARIIEAIAALSDGRDTGEKP